MVDEADGTLVAQPELRHALAHGDWSTVHRAYPDAGLLQSTIAARAGISQSQVSRLAAGRSRDPGIATVRALAAWGDLAEACRLAATAYDTGHRYGSERVRQAVRDFRSGLPTGRVTAALDERLHSAYRGPA